MKTSPAAPTRSPADAMSALSPEFVAAYEKAHHQIFDAVIEFERTTGRIVDQIALARVDVTRLESVGREFMRNVELHFLPKDSELG